MTKGTINQLRLLTPTLTIALITLFLFKLLPSPISASSPHILISQVQIAGSTTTDEFVELFNPTNQPVSLNSWKLSRKNSAGTQANLVASISGTIPAYGFFLIGHGTNYTGSTPLNQIYSAPSNALTSSYTVLLYDSDSLLIDKLGFGSAFDFETTSFPTSPTANTSLLRQPLDQDTDNNSTDFTTNSTPNPRNSSSPVLTPTPTQSPQITPTPSPTPTSTPIPTPTTNPTPTLIPTQEPTPTPTLEATPTPTDQITPTPKPNKNSHKNYRSAQPLKHFIQNCSRAVNRFFHHFHSPRRR